MFKDPNLPYKVAIVCMIMLVMSIMVYTSREVEYIVKEVPAEKKIPLNLIGKTHVHGRMSALFNVAQRLRSQITILSKAAKSENEKLKEEAALMAGVLMIELQHVFTLMEEETKKYEQYSLGPGTVFSTEEPSHVSPDWH